MYGYYRYPNIKIMQKKLQIFFKDPFFYVEKYFHLFSLFNKGCTSISCALYRYPILG